MRLGGQLHRHRHLYYGPYRYRGLLFNEASGTWSAGVQATLPANAGMDQVGVYLGLGHGPVSCASMGNCTAAGTYPETSGTVQGLLLTETSGTWSPGVQTTLPANASANQGVDLSSVSCPSAGSCTAVGVYRDTAGSLQGLLLTEPIEPKLSALGIVPHRLSLAGRRVGRRCVRLTSKNRSHKHCRRPIRLTVTYTLDMAATVTFTVKQYAPGRRVNRRCVKPTHKTKRRAKCTRLISGHGKIVRRGKAGPNHFTLTGTIGRHKLGPGSYELTATPTAARQAGSPASAKFKLAG